MSPRWHLLIRNHRNEKDFTRQRSEEAHFKEREELQAIQGPGRSVVGLKGRGEL